MPRIIKLNNKWRIRKDIQANGRNQKHWFENIETGKTALFKYPTRQDNGKLLKDYVTEVLASSIAKMISIKSAKAYFAEYNNKIGSISINFLRKNDVLIEGTVLMERFAHVLQDDKKVIGFENSLKMLKISAANNNRIEQSLEIPYTIDNILTCLRELELDKEFVKIVLFDALIGNKDRNQSNIGVVYNEKTRRFSLAPLYDNGSSFGIDKIDDLLSSFKILKKNSFLNDKKIQKTMSNKILNITQNTPSKIQLSQNNNINHFNLVEYIINLYPQESKKVIDKIEENITEEKLSKMLSKVSNRILSQEEKSIIMTMLLIRKQKILQSYDRVSISHLKKQSCANNKLICI